MTPKTRRNSPTRSTIARVPRQGLRVESRHQQTQFERPHPCLASATATKEISAPAPSRCPILYPTDLSRRSDDLSCGSQELSCGSQELFCGCQELFCGSQE